MWGIFFVLMLTVGICAVIYLTTRFHRFGIFRKIENKHRLLSWILAFLCIAVIGGGWMYFNFWTSAVVLIHLLAFWGITDLISFLITKPKNRKVNYNLTGIFVLLFTTGYLTYGWFTAHRVVPTYYTFETKKNLGTDNFRIAMIADSHLGITLDGEKFAVQMKRIESENPDVVIVAGDFVDDDSRKSDMVRACKALGEIKSEYGVYYSFGNHDKGYFDSQRDFTEKELREELLKNNVKILEDEHEMLNENICIIGRQDKREEQTTGRALISDIMNSVDNSCYSVVMNHQPNDYKAESESGCDLVLSGHTHGGHIYPAGFIGLIMGFNDRVYGTENRKVSGDTNFVVTSGISGWAIPFKTGTKSEYVIIDVKCEK